MSYSRIGVRAVASQTCAVLGRVLREFTRQRRNLVFWAVFPLLMLLLFGFMYKSNSGTRSSFDATPAGILIGAALFFSCLGGPVSLIATERERRTLRRLLVSPLHPAAYFLGIALAFLVVACGQSVVVYGAAYTMGARYHGSVLLGAVIVLLSVFAYVGLGFFFGARFARRAEDVNGPVATFGVPLLVLGGTFFPTTLLPGGLLKVARFDPVFHMNEALKGVSGGGETLAAAFDHLAFLVVFAAFSLALGIWSYRRMLVEEKRA